MATFIEDRGQRLAAINAELDRHGLRSLNKLGDASKGEIEILGIRQVFDDNARFFTDVSFDVRFPNGTDGVFKVRWNANSKVSDGAVFVVIVNGKIAIVKQWRLTLSRWTYEVPRGFGDKLDQAYVAGQLGTLKIADLPLGTLMRELGEEVMDEAEVFSITHLGNAAENTGTSTVTPSFFLVQLRVDEGKLARKLGGSEELKVELWTLDEVRQEVGRRLLDLHSIGAIHLALQHIESLATL